MIPLIFFFSFSTFFQGCFELFKCVTDKGFSKVFQGYIKVCFDYVSRVSHDSLIGVLRLFCFASAWGGIEENAIFICVYTVFEAKTLPNLVKNGRK